MIVADEAYFEFVRDPEYPDSLDDHDDRRLIITMRTFSKIFGLAGMRVGYAVARPDIIQMLHNVRQPFNVTSLAQVAAIAGMDDKAHIARTLQVNAEGMDYLEREFTRLKLAFVPSHANFFLVDVGDGRAIYDQLLRKGVIVRADAGLRVSASRADQRGAAGGESAAGRGARRSDGRAVMNQKRLADWLARYEIVAMFAGAVWAWPSAPAQIPIHWNIAGQIDGYGSKFWLLLMPIIATAGYALIGLSAVIRPEKFDSAATSALSWFRCTCVYLMGGVFGVIVSDTLYGANLNMNYIVLSLLALVMLTGANLIQQVRRLKSTKTSPPRDGVQV